MDTATLSGDVDLDAVAAYVERPATASLLYVLTLVQPLRGEEIAGHPFRAQYLSLHGLTAGSAADVEEDLRRGAAAGSLVAAPGAGGPYYFLNSDLGYRPAPLTEDEAPTQVRQEGPEVTRIGETALPLGAALGRHHPIPHFRDPSTCLSWFHWARDVARRRVLRVLQEAGGVRPAELREAADVDHTVLVEGIQSGVLRSQEGRLTFPFAEATIPPGGGRWTADPPTFLLTRSEEPLQCLEGGLGNGPNARERSPMAQLSDALEAGRAVLPERRLDHLRLNILYRPTALVPRIDELSPESLPSVWENRRGRYFEVTGGYDRAVAIQYLMGELEAATEEVKTWRREALHDLARRKLDAYFRNREAALLQRIRRETDGGYGLGPDAIQSVAHAELQREGLMAERKYFEKFLEVLAE